MSNSSAVYAEEIIKSCGNIILALLSSANPATQVVQVTTSDARSCLRADFRRFWRRVVHLKTITQQDAGAKTED